VRADYIYSLETYRKKVDCIVIEDLNMGSISVTNDIENVIKEICSAEKIDKEQFMIVYKDSTGQWDGWDAITQEFELLREETWFDAIELWIARKTKL